MLEGHEGATPRSGMNSDSTLDTCIDLECNNMALFQTTKSATSENLSLVKLLHLVRESSDKEATEELCKWVPKARGSITP